MTKTNISTDFLVSSLTLENPFIKTEEIIPWLKYIRDGFDHLITQIPFNDLERWGFNPSTGDLVHETGRFFSIQGLQVNTNSGNVPHWTQPIINQPEIGFLGFVAKRFNGVLYFLMQAKAEPGNINGVQLSPTLQATKSNYTRAHKGVAPKYLNYFINRGQESGPKVLLDQLQSEQGARFWKKRNRNIIVEVDSEVPVDEEFQWMSLGQIKWLLQFDNVVNMDTRTVVSGIPFGYDESRISELKLSEQARQLLLSEINPNSALHDTDGLISWLTEIKFSTVLDVNLIPLNSLKDWEKTENEIRHVDGKYFSVMAASVVLGNREVHRWTQPLIKSAQEGIIAYITKSINGVPHFLVQAKLECGNFDLIELAPTVQCLTGNYRKGMNEYEVPFLDCVLNPETYGGKVVYSAFQSEEGGRFYMEQNKNIIVEMGEDFGQELPDRYTWMTMHQLKTFVRFNNYLNIQSRSLLSAISFH